MSYKPSIFLTADENASIWKLVKKKVESCSIAFVKKFEIKKGNKLDAVSLCFIKTSNTGLYFIYIYDKDKKLVWCQEVSAKLKMKLKPNMISLKNEDEEYFRIHFLCDEETKSIFGEISQALTQLKKHEKNKNRWKKLLVLKKSVKKFHYWECCGLTSSEFIILEKWNIPTQILMKKNVRRDIVEFFKNNDVKKIMELVQQNDPHQGNEVVSEDDSTRNKSDEECSKIDGVLLRRPTRKAPVPPKQQCPVITIVEPEKTSSMPPPPPPLPILNFPRLSQDTLDLQGGIKCKQLRRSSCPESKANDIHSQLMDAIKGFNKNKLESVPKHLNESRDLDTRDELLMNIKNFNLRSLKPVQPGNSGAPETETDSQDKLLKEILNFDRKKLKPSKKIGGTPELKSHKFNSGIFGGELMSKLKAFREDIESSDSESDDESSDFDDEWEN